MYDVTIKSSTENVFMLLPSKEATRMPHTLAINLTLLNLFDYVLQSGFNIAASLAHELGSNAINYTRKSEG